MCDTKDFKGSGSIEARGVDMLSFDMDCIEDHTWACTGNDTYVLEELGATLKLGQDSSLDIETFELIEAPLTLEPLKRVLDALISAEAYLEGSVGFESIHSTALNGVYAMRIITEPRGYEEQVASGVVWDSA